MAVSLCLNLLLVAAVAFAFRGAPSLGGAPVPGEEGERLLASSPTTATNLPASVLTITNRFHWSQVESPHYERYMANLRAVGCPEKTIRDILVRDIEKTYALRMAKRPGPTNFWACGPEREAAEAGHRKELTSLRSEQRELTRRLLGMDYVSLSSDFDDLAGRALLLFITGTTREGALEKVVDIFKMAEMTREEIREEANGWQTPAHEAELTRNRKQTLEQLRAALSPAELEEFGLRFAAVKMMEGDLDDFKCSAAELRAIAAAYYHTVGFEGLNFELFDTERDMPDQQQDELLARIKEALGERRFEDFLRETDSDYAALSEFVTASSLPGNIASALSDVRRLAERERGRLLADTAVTGPVRRDRLQVMRRETLEAVRSQLGESAYQEYSKRGLGSWIEELARP